MGFNSMGEGKGRISCCVLTGNVTRGVNSILGRNARLTVKISRTT